ncbi:MAG: DUF2334 domain-containing protein [Parachlamydiaceae bacterium]|nr:DUF2334 domain-containing protein [Parachlamydiaceae bacterium]
MQKWPQIFIYSLITFSLWNPPILFSAPTPLPTQQTHTKCVQIFYDKVPGKSPTYYGGRAHATLLQNLLGHFPSIQQYVIPIESYQPGQLDKCDASIYISSFYGNSIPQDFLNDFVNTKKNVAWLGYNISKLSSEQLSTLWGISYVGSALQDLEQLDADENPGFYKFYEYKGEVFEKYGQYSAKDSKHFLASFDIALVNVTEPQNVISWAQHSTQKDKRTPYILRNQNHWFIADNPFVLMGVDDRYLIFADILFDILNEPPHRPHQKLAIVRLEDVNIGTTKIEQIHVLSDLFAKLQIPFTVSLIPKFFDPFLTVVKKPELQTQSILDSADFVKALHYAKDKGASFIMHGITHQYGVTKNPFNGVSGSDFEFWNKVNDTPIQEDNASYVLYRLGEGVAIMEQAGLPPVAWMTPHYQASPLDSVIFGDVFTWNIGRMSYWPHKILGAQPFPESLTFDQAGTKANNQRLPYFSILVVEYPKNTPATPQLFPYEIYGDSFGQRIIPENIGNVQTYLSEQVVALRTIDDMIKTIKRNRVLRDVWAGFFIHPFLLNTAQNWGIAEQAGDTSAIERLLQETKNAGYEFIDLADWIKQNKQPKTLPVIEIDPPSYQ